MVYLMDCVAAQAMVRRYVRKTTRGCWDERAMVSAMDAIQSKKMGYLQSAKKHGVPRSTLRRIMKKLAADGEVNIRSPLGSKASIFTASEEKQLAAHLLTIEKNLFIITNVARRKLAYQLATKIGKANKWKDNIAGREWLRDFMRRNEEVAVKPSPPGKPAAPKVVGFNKPAVTKFYEVLGDLYNKHQLTSDRIYNCDEVSITCDAKSQGKSISLKGHTPGAPGSAPVEPGKTITVELCMSATGVFMPLLFVFPRSSLDPQFTSHLILPCYTRCHESGWMMSDSFFCWLNYFVKFSRATPKNPVLLLMDGDTSHTMTIPLLELARDNGVIMLCLPQNCTHKLQPLEAEFFGPLSKHYTNAVANWVGTHPGQPVTIYQIPMLFEQAFIQSATMVTALIAFRKTGIWPFNPHNFTEQDFAGAASNLLPQQNGPAIEPVQNSVVNNNKEPVPLTHSWKGNNCAEEMRATTSTSFVEAVLGEPQNHQSRKRPNQFAVPVIQQSCSQSHSKEPTIASPPWKSMVNCVNDMRASSALEAALEHQNNQQRKRSQHPIASSLPGGQLNYQINNMEPAMPGPHWKSANSVNEMRLSTSSAYVEAVFGGPQNHPSRNMEEPQVPGPSSAPSIYNMIPHMFM